MKNTKLEIINSQGIKLSAKLELPADQKPDHYAIFAHCFTCNQNLNAVRHISRTLTMHGFAMNVTFARATFAHAHACSPPTKNST